MDSFRFAHAWALLLLIPGAWMMMRRHWRAKPSALLYSDTRLVAGIAPTWRVRLAWLPDVLRAAVWLLLVIALARPQFGQGREVLRGQGIDIVVALDISGSMAALDMTPDRLNAAKAVITDFVAGREYDRIGVVLFARSAYHLVPLTLDYTVLSVLLGNVELVTEMRDAGGAQTGVDGTALGMGIASAAGMMRESAALSKVIILLTDGANNAGIDPVMAADAANALGIRIYTIGMGFQGEVSFPDGDGGVTTLASDLDEPTLMRIAEASGGVYFHAADEAALRDITAQIDRLERSPVQRQLVIPWRDQTEILLGMAVMLLLVERLLRLTVFAPAP